MLRLTILIYVILLVSCEVNKQVALNGEFGDSGWSPMWSKYIFETDSTFRYYWGDDLYGSFGRGSYSLSGRRLTLTYEALTLDEPHVIFTESDDSDSLTVEFEFVDFPLQVVSLESSDTTLIWKDVYEYPIKLKVSRPIGSLVLKIEHHIESKKEVRFKIASSNLSYIKLEYYPSNSWFRYYEPGNEKMRLYNLTDSTFEMRYRRYKWVYSKQ